MGFRTVVGGLFSGWLRPYVQGGSNGRDILIDITSPEYLMSNLNKLFKILRLKLWVITGDEISSQKRLAIFYAGHEFGKNCLAKLAFGNYYRENYIGKKWFWEVPKVVGKGNHDCSLIVTEAPDSFRKSFEEIKCLYVPFWIYGKIDLTVDNSSVFDRKNSSLRSDLSKIRKNTLLFEVRNEFTLLHDFYYNMHIPYITGAHGNRSEIVSYSLVKREFRKGGELLFIKKGNEYIAGILLIYRKDRAILYILGIKDGNLNYVEEGCIGALIYFSFAYLTEKNFKTIDFGASRPFLKDGVLQYKKKWNQKIYRVSKTGYFIKPLLKTDGVKGFFLNNPFIYEEQMSFKGAIFVDSDQSLSKKDFKKICQDFYINGLSKLVIYRFREAHNKTRNIIPPEFSDRITINSAESIF